jgi:hypothetical protein
MKFTEVMAHIAVALRDRLSDYTELLRAVREGSDELEVTERKLSHMAANEGHPFHWGGGAFKNLLRSKPGPGGGFEATPSNVAFFLTAYLLDVPRREAAAKALDITFAAYTPPVHGKKNAVCPKTKQRYFGAALVDVLSDRALFDKVDEVRVCADLGCAQLVFKDKDGTTTEFYTAGGLKKPAGSYTMRHLPLDLIGPLVDLVNAPSASMSA